MHIARIAPVKGSNRHFAALRIFLYVSCLAILIIIASNMFLDHRQRHRGVVYGPPRQIPLASAEPFGVNASLERYESEGELQRALTMIEDCGFRWVRQRFPWAEIEPRRGEYHWERGDGIVALCKEYDLSLIAVLDTSPPWARSEEDAGNKLAPPLDLADYARFVEAFVARYRGQIAHYQLWDEPNIHPHWGDRFVDPAGYVELLKAGYWAAKRSNPDALILSAGLAPNVEEGGRNMSDLLFLQGMYDAGARDFFDVLAVKPYGLWTGPEDRRASPDVTNFSRIVLLREMMIKNGDGGKAVWAVEFGWNSLPPDWGGRPSPWGSDSEARQAQRTVDAIERARDGWPWLGVMCLQHFQPAAPADDPIWGFAMVGEDFSPSPIYGAMQRLATAPPTAHVGHYPADAWAADYRGSWRRGVGTMAGQAGDSLTLRFKGTRLDLIALKDRFSGALHVVIDGEEFQLDLQSSVSQMVKVALAKGLPDTEHLAQLTVGEGMVTIGGFAVAREPSFASYYISLSLLGSGILLVLWRSIRLLLSPAWLDLWREIVGGYQKLGEWQQIAVIAIAVVLYYFSPWLGLSLVGLLLLFISIYFRLDLGLAVLVFSIPFFLYPKRIGPNAFSLVEVLTLLCFAAWLLLATRSWKLEGGGLMFSVKHLAYSFRHQGFDLPLLFSLLISLFSLAVSENLVVSLRELRVVIIEPLILYFLLRSVALIKKDLLRLSNVLIMAGLLVSLFGLYQYLSTDDVIVAEGVRRIRGVYASPNNLSLFLGRVVPISVAIALFGVSGRRRLLYGLASAPMLLCLYLTYSRGAWLLGMPAAFLFIGLMRGRRASLVSLAFIAAALLVLLPFFKVERIASILDVQHGTTFLRLKLWQATINMIRDHPIFGVGLDNFLYQYPKYMLPEAWQEPNLSHPHNIIMDYWTRLGIFGVVAILWLEVVFFKRGLRLYRHLDDRALQALTLGLMASMVDFLAHGLIDNSYFLVDLAFVFTLTMGLVRRMEGMIFVDT